ncbi:class A beta-lactamase [Primorskyibacter sp. 2E107]|uniref:Beta-lactamase n=1 Tax=Halocynthiibacter halioticoli TaxID=2986804 RepID=A0AAE3LSP4_9RHOB|nr:MULTISPECIES: class A beta-lactamase [Halocynthiibacter]MCV6826063.1 class A beta-lactamase [Halocynthiibacter halioticoli]MCW4059064.1 class A beta-lactamase [Halocynthiibacter sp. SDUM655004]
MKTLSRRLFTAGAASLLASAATGRNASYGTREWQPRTYDDGLIPRFSFEVISLQVDGDLGVSVLDTETGRASGWDETSTYPLNSTFKFLLAGAVLQRVDRGQERLDRQIAVRSSDIVAWSPIAKEAVGGNMSLRSLCEAAMTRSDNAATNLLLRSVGGPEALTATLRNMGDPVTRIDRYETEMNDVPPGDLRDSSTPSQMLKTMETLLLGNILTARSKEQLAAWMIANTTGGARIRAGVPSGWTVGDRTGTGPRGETATIAAIYPPNRKPLLMTIYIRGSSRNRDAQESTHAELARIATTNVVLPPYDPYPND